MKSIQSPSLPKEKRSFFFLFLLCNLAFTGVAFGGVNLIQFAWPENFHPYSNNTSSSTLEAEWIVYPNGLGGNMGSHDFYLVATTPHNVNGGEIFFRYGSGFNPYFGLYDNCTPQYPCPSTQYTDLNHSSIQPYIGTKVINSVSFSVLRYRFSNSRSPLANPVSTDLVCTNHSTTIAAASNGQTLPQSTIHVAASYIFPSSGKIQIVTSTGSPTIDYTGTFGNGTGTTTFTGCSGGTGTLATGQLVGELSGNTSTATHFRNTIELYNYSTQAWVVWYDHEFNHTAWLHDCASCGNVCAYWGPMFETNVCPPGGGLPRIGITDMLIANDNGRFVRGNTSNANYYAPLNACNPSLAAPYVVWSYLPNYQWIIWSLPIE